MNLSRVPPISELDSELPPGAQMFSGPSLESLNSKTPCGQIKFCLKPRSGLF